MKILRKGLTLVELSIVLVILGILISLTIKGKKLIETANWKSDFASIRQINTGLFIFMENNDFNFRNMPLIYPSKYNHVNYGVLIRNGYLDERSLSLKSFTSPGNIDFKSPNLDISTIPLTILHGCEEKSPDEPFLAVMSAGFMCGEIRNGSDTTRGLSESISPYQVCMLETALDDKNTSTGIGRTRVKNTPYVSQNDSCDTISREPVNSFGWLFLYVQ